MFCIVIAGIYLVAVFIIVAWLDSKKKKRLKNRAELWGLGEQLTLRKAVFNRFFEILILGAVFMFVGTLCLRLCFRYGLIHGDNPIILYIGGPIVTVLLLAIYVVLVRIVVAWSNSKKRKRIKNRNELWELGTQLTLGNFLISKGSKSEDYDEAEKILEKVCEQGGRCPQAYFDAGVLLMGASQYNRARTWLSTAKEQGHTKAQAKLEECIKKAEEAKRKAAEEARSSSSSGRNFARKRKCDRPGCDHDLPSDMRYGGMSADGKRFYCCKNCETLGELDRSNQF
ncbi:MAG: hypothetical protein LBV47_04605 [Bacteroidales bacterium]|nr:hypothetical protein [Bacteroidales bacterium]